MRYICMYRFKIQYYEQILKTLMVWEIERKSEGKNGMFLCV